MVETVPKDGEEIVITFKHIPSEVGSYEAEEVCSHILHMHIGNRLTVSPR